MAERGEEISDLIVGFDPVTLARLPVHKKAVVDRFLSEGNRAAAKVVAALPEKDGVLDPTAVDRLLIRVHCELQGLSEEFQHGARVAELLRPLLEALRLCKIPPPYRIVDVGCGPGFVVRWLAARGELGSDVELVGADYNVALVEEGRRLAALENLKVSFVVANAFRIDRLASPRQHARAESAASARTTRTAHRTSVGRRRQG